MRWVQKNRVMIMGVMRIKEVRDSGVGKARKAINDTY